MQRKRLDLRKPDRELASWTESVMRGNERKGTLWSSLSELTVGKNVTRVKWKRVGNLWFSKCGWYRG